MATDDQQVLVVGKASAPAHFTIPGNGQIRPKAIYAQFDGTAAGTVYTPALQIISDAGKVVGIYRTTQAVAAGGSAVVSWFPGADLDDASGTGGGGGGTIQNIVSPGATIAVTAPSGPTTSLDLPVSGVAAGTYGDATHTAQVQVNVDGIVTSATQVGISGLAGSGLVKLFDSTLGGDAASIDTGANAIPTGHGVLLVYITVRTARAANNTDTLGITFNGDTATHYWRNVARLLNTTFGGFQSGATPLSSIPADVYGDTGPTNAAATVDMVIPNYDGTTFLKTCLLRAGLPSSTDAASETAQGSHAWTGTAAINQITVVSQTAANLRAGSRMQIYGVQ